MFSLIYLAFLILGMSGLVLAVGRQKRGKGHPPKGENSGWHTVVLFAIGILGLAFTDIILDAPLKAFGIPYGLFGMGLLGFAWITVLPLAGAHYRKTRK